MVLTLALRVPASEITNSVHITTNLVFSLHGWKTIGPQSQFNSNEEIVWGLIGTSTNNIGYRHFPSGNFNFHLFAENGKEVVKTKTGIALTDTPLKPTEADIVYRRYPSNSVDNKGGEYRKLFRPDDIFVITNKGVYELEVQMRLCVIMTNGAPDLKAMINWRNVFPHGYPYVTNFGVLTSPPLRVKVIKN